MKIAIFGGSFNPVHIEHVNIVKAAKRALSPDKIIIIPSNITPNKTGKLTVSAQDRLNLCRLAFGGIDGAEISDCEIKRGGISYSFVTCNGLKSQYPSDELYFIVGADMLANFAEWKNPESILNCVKLSVCARENEQSLTEAENKFKSHFNVTVEKFGYTGAKVSSTRIRALAALSESVNGYTAENAANYIKDNSLYAIKGLSEVKEYLTPKRWAHTVRVAVTAAENCSKINISEQTAVTAAALHDCAKYLNPDSPLLKGFVRPDGVPDSVLHQYTGAYVAEKHFGVTDENILNAIRYHTSGRENMTDLEKLIYLSDLLEEGRDFEGIENLRKIFSSDLDECMYLALKHQLEYLESTGKSIYPLTRKAYEYLKENR